MSDQVSGSADVKPRGSAEDLEEVWTALRDASDDMLRASERDGPGPLKP